MTQTVHVFLANNAARSALSGGGAPAIVMTHLAQFTLSVAFVGTDGETIGELGGTVSSARCVVKALPTSSFLLLDSALELTGADTTARYEGEWDDADLDSAALRSALGDKLELDAYLEIEWTIDGSTQRTAFPIVIRNSFFRPADTAPDPAAEASLEWLVLHAARYYPAITALTGGTSTCLDSIPTVGLAARTRVQIVINDGTYDQLQDWMLYASTTAESTADGIVRPDDYATTTNEKVWKRIA